MSLQTYFDKRAKAHADFKAVLAEASDADGLTEERQAKLDGFDAEIAGFDKLIAAEKRAAEREAELAASEFDQRSGNRATEVKGDAGADPLDTPEYRDAFGRYLRSQSGNRLDSGTIDILSRSQNTTDANGGFMIPTTLSNRILAKEKLYTTLGGLVNNVSTASGNPIDFVTEDSTNAIGAWIAEEEEDTFATQTFGKKTLGAHMATSRVFQMSWEIMRDAQFDIEGRIADIAGRRLARVKDQAFTLGTGTNQPEGLVPNARQTVTSAAADAVTYEEIVDLIHSIDPAYRPGARLMFSDLTLASLKKLKDADGRPLWNLSVRDGEPDRFAGVPYVINQFMAPVGAGARSIVYGDMSQYTVRNVGGLQIQRFDELFALKRQIGFAVYSAVDGKLLGLDGIVALENAAS